MISNRTPWKTLWYTRCQHPSPLGLAAQLGWFLDEFTDDGIDVFTLQETADLRLLASHLDHHLTNSFRQGGSTPAIWARSRGADTRVIGFNWVDEFQAILTSPKSGISGPEGLRGCSIALPVTTGVPIDIRRAEALRGFRITLEYVGLSIADVATVDISLPEPDPRTRNAPLTRYAGYEPVIEAVLNGTVDAVYVKGSRGLQTAFESGCRVTFDIRNHPDPLSRVNQGAPRPITVDSTLLREHPDIVVRFLTRVAAVGQWAVAHPAETLLYMSRETKSPERWVRLAYGEDLHLRQRTLIDRACIEALRRYKDFLLESGFIGADFAVEEWVDPAPLDTALERLRAKTAPLFLEAG
jgi:ABC-type nitrate/sulfonate/bicarbonate transport system substrate-binding protein